MKTSTKFVALSLCLAMTSSAIAKPLEWGSRAYQTSYATIATGAVAAGYFYLSRSRGFGDASVNATFAIVGLGIAAVGAVGLLGNMVSDSMSDEEQAKKMAAQHRALNKQSQVVLKGTTHIVDPNFNELLSVYECATCNSDSEKSVKLAKLVLESQKIADELKGQENLNSPEINTNLIESLRKEMGEDATDKNILLAKFIVSQALVNQLVK